MGCLFSYEENIHNAVTSEELEEYINSYANNNLHKPITVNKLMAILYVIQGVFLAKYNRDLFEEDFEAWLSGPVLPSIFKRNKIYGGYIPFLPEKRKDTFIEKFTPAQLNDLNSIIELLMPYEGYSLLQKFKKNSPYINNYRVSFFGESPRIIPKEDIKKFFERII